MLRVIVLLFITAISPQARFPRIYFRVHSKESLLPGGHGPSQLGLSVPKGGALFRVQ